jgi:hypothetical protein
MYHHGTNGSQFTPPQLLLSDTPVKIGVVVDMREKENGKLYYIVNGVPCGIALSGLSLPLHPSFAIGLKNDVIRLLPAARLPPDYEFRARGF